MLLFCAQNAERYVSEFTDQFPEDLKIGDLYLDFDLGYCRRNFVSGEDRLGNVFEIYKNISIWTSNLWQRFDVFKHIRLTDTI
jgi:hypothetical protein